MKCVNRNSNVWKTASMKVEMGPPNEHYFPGLTRARPRLLLQRDRVQRKANRPSTIPGRIVRQARRLRNKDHAPITLPPIYKLRINRRDPMTVRSSKVCPPCFLSSSNFLFYRSAHGSVFLWRGCRPGWRTEDTPQLFVQTLDLFFNRGRPFELGNCKVK